MPDRPYQYIDVAPLLKTVGGNAVACVQLVGTFIHSSPSIFAKLVSALKKTDAVKVQQQSHALKGMALLLAAKSFSDALAAIESQARQGVIDDASLHLIQLEALFENVLNDARRYVHDAATEKLDKSDC